MNDRIEGDSTEQPTDHERAIDQLARALGRLLAIDQLFQDCENEELRQAISKCVGRQIPPIRFGGVASFEDA